MKGRKAQALVLTLWIVLTLTVLAINTGHSVSIGLRLANYTRDRLISFAQAKSALSAALRQIRNDPEAAIGASDKNWSIVDEDRKININSAPRELLIALFEEYGIAQPQETADNLLIWRGEKPDNSGVYLAAGYPCKGAPLSVFEELACIKGLSRNSVEPFREAVTLAGTGKFNLNTVPARTLKVLARGCAKELGIDEQFAASVSDKLVQSREYKGHFQDANDLELAATGAEETAVLNELLKNAVYKSDYFSIEARGIVSKITCTLKAVYNRNTNSFLYWHES